MRSASSRKASGESWSRNKITNARINCDQLSESVEMVLNNPSFKEVALNLKKSFQKSDGYKEAVDEIFIFVGQ